MISYADRRPVTRSKWWRLLISFAAVILAIAVTTPLANRLDLVVGDVALMQHQRGQSEPVQDIVLVEITEETLAALPYRSPIDRQFLAELISAIDAGAPKVIGLDILMDGPSEPVKDRHFFTTVDGLAAPIVFASATQENGLTEKQFAYLSRVLANRLSGSIVLQRDKIDGVLRHLPEIQDKQGRIVPTFAQVLANPDMFRPLKTGRILYQPGEAVGGSPFTNYPAHTVALLPPEWFKGKIVLIGTNLPIIDRHLTPIAASQGSEDGTLPGIEVHAHILNQILTVHSLPTLSYWQALTLTLLATILSVTAFNSFSRPALFFVGLTAAIGVYALIFYVLLAREIVLVPLIAPPASALLATLFLSLSRWWQERAEREFLELAFSKYVSKTVVKRLTSGNIRLSLGGEKRVVTYLFTDLEGFTSLSQTLPPDQMGSLLNAYLDKMCDLITAHGATIDKIIGDAVVCFFGAPDADADQAENGVRLALALDAFCEEFRMEANGNGIPLGVTRIGLHTGEATVGNFGGKRFFDYTGIGDTVNIAARLESANRHLGTRICVSESIAERCPDFFFRPLGKLVLKGRNTAVTCLQPCTSETWSSPWMEKYLEAYRLLRNK